MINACLASLNGDPTQYGSVLAADDLEAVRAALGYRRLDVYGGSYGATLAQIYLARHPRSVRTVTLDGATLLDVPFFERFATNGQRALDQVGRALRRRPGVLARVPRLAGAAPLARHGLERAASPDHARSDAHRRRSGRSDPVAHA